MSGLIGIDPPPRPLVIIGLAAGDMMHTKTAICLWAMGRGAKDHRQGIALGQSSHGAAGCRNECVDGAIAAKADYVFFYDSDMMSPMNTIDRLLAHKKDICCATYIRRGPPFDKLGHPVRAEDLDQQTGLTELTHMPTGCALIKMSVFDRLKKPYFRQGFDEVHGKLRGEDFIFSEMVCALPNGYSIWCDNDLSKEIGHLYQYVLMIPDPTVEAVRKDYTEPKVANG